MSGDKTANVSMLAFGDPQTFRTGNLHLHASLWEHLASAAPNSLAYQVCDWISNCVNVHDFFQHFKGSYKGETFDLPTPPPRVFYNSVSCKPFVNFISDTIISRLFSGAIFLSDTLES